MTQSQFLIRGLLYYWRTNLAIVLGVVAGTAVIGGALVVGDSVRDSLKQMTLERLGEIDYVLSGERFFRQELAEEFGAQLGDEARIAPGLFVAGSFEHTSGASVTRANQVNIYGIDERFWSLSGVRDVPPSADREVVLNRRVADQLGVEVGDGVTLWVEMPATIPRESLLGEREEWSREVPLTVSAILGDETGVSRFALNPSQQLPLNAFVDLATLQRSLDLQEVPRSRRNPEAQPARINTICVATADDPGSQSAEEAARAAEALTAKLGGQLQLDDLRLRIVTNMPGNYVSLESRQMILESRLADAGRRAVDQLREQLDLQQSVPVKKVLVYLANEISNPDDPERFSMYSVVAGLNWPCALNPAAEEADCIEPDFGSFQVRSESTPEPPGELPFIFVNSWLAEDLGVSAGDTVNVKYHVVGSHGELPELTRQFRVRAVVEMTGPAADRGLTPELQGITDADSFDEWEQPFPMQLGRVTPRDDEYWELHRATPKAFLPLDVAQELWRSRYGELTSVRIEPLPNDSLEQTAAWFTRAFLDTLQPAEAGLFFQPIKFTGLQAAGGTTDFSQLFFGFSCFLILAATILIVLLFRLGIDQRGSGIGLLSAVGFTPRQIQRQFLAEGAVVVGLGGLLGIAAAVGYAELMVYGLKTWWLGAMGTKFLFVSVHPLSLVTGFVISAAMMIGAVWWSLRQLRLLSTRQLLAGVVEQPLSESAKHGRSRRMWRVGMVCAAVSSGLVIAALIGWIPNQEAFMGLSWQVVAFFVVGTCLLAASVSFLSVWLDSDRAAAVRGGGAAALGRLGLRNAARHRQRSVFTVGLIASATFVIVAVASGHRNPAAELPDFDSGNGGFLLVAQSSQPILEDLNSPEGRGNLGIRAADDAADAKLLEQMQLVPFRYRPGQDASCLNLYQAQVPTLLGVPQQMIDRGGFKFANTPGENPWALLNETPAHQEFDGKELPVVPVLGDMNSLMYNLHLAVGDVLPVPSAERPDFLLRIAGMFDGSVFQGVLLMSEENFTRWFPDRAGYQYFLIGDGRYQNGNHRGLSPEEARALGELLETELAPYGFDAEPVVERLDDFLAVQNTYLSTFQSLGGLGLMLGTLGLATVMLRNIVERRGELALLRAVGFRNTHVGWLVVWENAFLLVWGLLAGTLSALLAMTPHLTTIGADVPWGGVGLILGGVFLLGMTSALLAVREAIRTPILQTLRAE